MIGLRGGQLGPKATPLLNRSRPKKEPWRVWGQTAIGLSTYRCLLCAIARQWRVTATPPPFEGAVERGAHQPDGNHCSKLHTLQDLISDVRRLVVQHDIQQGEVDLHDAVVM
jgi:hypothetical protein